MAKKSVNIKNYTSQVPAKRSIQRIEDCLIKHGAKNIIKMVENERIVGLAFVVDINGKEYPFKLPARIKKIENHFKNKGHMSPSAEKKAIEQAERTAWKLLYELIEIQMSLIYLDQTEIMEIFLPYLYDTKEENTFFEKMKINDFKMLENKLSDG
jgi:formyltetrahydrofolate synthetase